MRAAWWAAGAMVWSLVACQEDDERPGLAGDRGVVADGAVDGGAIDDRGVEGDGAVDRGVPEDRGVDPDGTPVIDAGGGATPDAGDAGGGIDMGLQPPEFECPDCDPDEMCFQFYDGTCSLGQPRCIPRVEGCAPRTCTPECNQTLCVDDGVPFSSCDTGLACGVYSKLFGWISKGDPEGNHVGWHNGENPFGGIGKPQAGAPAHWLGYIETDALEGTVERAKKMGAKVFAGPMSIGEGGDIAVLADPQGAVIGLYEGGAGHEGWEPRKSEAGDFGWAELGTSDIDGARAFYGENFGWSTADAMQTPEGAYHMLTQGEGPIAGLYTKPADMPMSAWTFYINVNDVEETVAKAKALGGKVMVGPQTVPDMVTVALLTDPQGAVFGVVQPVAG